MGYTLFCFGAIFLFISLSSCGPGLERENDLHGSSVIFGIALKLGQKIENNLAQILEQGSLPCENERCNCSLDILQHAKIDPNQHELTSRNIEDVAAIFLYNFLYYKSICDIPKQKCWNFDSCVMEIFPDIDETDIEISVNSILTRLNMVLKTDSNTKCHSISSIVDELESFNQSRVSNGEKMRRLFTIVVTHVIKGHCFDVGGSKNEFLNEIFHMYGDECSSVITIDGLKRLMKDLQNKDFDHSHGHDHNHHYEESHPSHHHSDEADCQHSEAHANHLHIHASANHNHGNYFRKNNNNKKHNDHDHDHNGNDHDHKDHDYNDYKHKDHDHNDHDHKDHDHKDHDYNPINHDHKDHDHDNHNDNGHDHNNHNHDHDHDYEHRDDYDHYNKNDSNNRENINSDNFDYNDMHINITHKPGDDNNDKHFLDYNDNVHYKSENGSNYNNYTLNGDINKHEFESTDKNSQKDNDVYKHTDVYKNVTNAPENFNMGERAFIKSEVENSEKNSSTVSYPSDNSSSSLGIGTDFIHLASLKSELSKTREGINNNSPSSSIYNVTNAPENFKMGERTLFKSEIENSEKNSSTVLYPFDNSSSSLGIGTDFNHLASLKSELSKAGEGSYNNSPSSSIYNVTNAPENFKMEEQAFIKSEVENSEKNSSTVLYPSDNSSSSLGIGFDFIYLASLKSELSKTREGINNNSPSSLIYNVTNAPENFKMGERTLFKSEIENSEKNSSTVLYPSDNSSSSLGFGTDFNHLASLKSELSKAGEGSYNNNPSSSIYNVTNAPENFKMGERTLFKSEIENSEKNSSTVLYPSDNSSWSLGIKPDFNHLTSLKSELLKTREGSNNNSPSSSIHNVTNASENFKMGERTFFKSEIENSEKNSSTVLYPSDNSSLSLEIKPDFNHLASLKSEHLMIREGSNNNSPSTSIYDVTNAPENLKMRKRAVFKSQIENKEKFYNLQIGTNYRSLASKCLSAEELVALFGGVSNTSITKMEFLMMCPAIIQQAVTGNCHKSVIQKKIESSLWEVYGYSILSVFLISLTSLAGVVLLPILKKDVYHYIMAGCIGLAFSTLAGDALFHLIPQALDIHSHSHDEPHEHETHMDDPNLWKLVGVFLSVYALYVFETTMHAFSKNTYSHGKGRNGHRHVNDPKDVALVTIKVQSESRDHLALSPQQSSSSLDTEVAENEVAKKPDVAILNFPTICGMPTVAFLVTLGDAIHNFGDGLAIGAAFSSGISTGLSTSIAVFCHELPHEFGDFVILLSSGLPFTKALWINFLSGLSCLAGLIIGLQMGVNTNARMWIMAITAGIFLYVALTEMLPELKENKKGGPVKMLIVKNIGILAGMTIMILISVYEHKLGV